MVSTLAIESSFARAQFVATRVRRAVGARLCGLVLGLVLTPAISSLAEEPHEILVLDVAPNGPLATLEQARDAARPFVGKRPVRIVIRGATYALGAPLVLDERDSGTAEAPVVLSNPAASRWGHAIARVLAAARIEADGTWVAEVPPDARQIRHVYVDAPVT